MNDIHELAGAYVLGTLSAERRREVEKRLPHEPELRDAVAEWENKLLPMTALAGEVEPSAQLWPRIQASLGLGRVVRWWDSLKLWRGLTAGGFATAALMAFLLFGRPAPETRFMVVLVAPQDKAPGWVIQASTNNRLKLIPLGKLEVPGDKSLQFWTKADTWSGPVSLGLVKPGESLEVFLDKLPPLQPNQLFEITLEPYAGSPLNKPTGPVLHIGRAVKVM